MNLYLSSLAFTAIMGGPLDGLPSFHLRLGKRKVAVEDVYFKILDALPRFPSSTLVIEDMGDGKAADFAIISLASSLIASGFTVIALIKDGVNPAWISSCSGVYLMVYNPRYQIIKSDALIYVAPDADNIPVPMAYPLAKKYLLATKATKVEAVLSFLQKAPGWNLISPPSRSFEWRLIE